MPVRYRSPAPPGTANQAACQPSWRGSGGAVSSPWTPMFSASLAMDRSRGAGRYSLEEARGRSSPVITTVDAVSSRPHRTATPRATCSTGTTEAWPPPGCGCRRPRPRTATAGCVTSQHHSAGRDAGPARSGGGAEGVLAVVVLDPPRNVSSGRKRSCSPSSGSPPAGLARSSAVTRSSSSVTSGMSWSGTCLGLQPP